MELDTKPNVQSTVIVTLKNTGASVQMSRERNIYDLFLSRIRPRNIKNRLVVAKEQGCGEMGEMGEAEWELQASGSGLSKSQGWKVPHGE